MATQFTHTMDGAVRSGASGGLSALVHWFGRLLHDVQRRRQARESFRHLLTLDDRILDDIGLTRHDVERAADAPRRTGAARALQDWRAQARLRS